MSQEVVRPQLEWLLGPVSSAVRAASVLPSLSRVVEELVLNSLDACSTKIEIKVDFSKFFVEVNDDGVGICYEDLRDVAGEWNSTSKKENGSSHGFRGEALAATRILSSMTVTSKTGDCRSTYVKSFLKNEDNAGEPYSEINLSPTAIARSGTKVKVWHLFEGLPARRKAMRPNTEMIRLKEFVQRMSILYHDVDWLLVDERTGSIIMKLEVRPSVSARFSVFHGQQIQQKMKSVSASYDTFQLSGLLSPPVADCCHWTKKYQYLFVNNRWMRGKDIVANMVDKVYVTSMTSQKSGGPASKHHMPKGNQASSHPCFVLQLTCPTDSYDVLSEPDKTKAVFSDPYALKQCVKKLLLQMFKKHNPDLLAAADSLCGGYYNGDATYGAFRTEDDANQDENPTAKNDAPALGNTKLYAVHPKEASESKRWTPYDKGLRTMRNSEISAGPVLSKSPTFGTAFLETPPDKGPIAAEARQFTSQPISLFAEFEFDSSVTSDRHDSDEADTTEGALSPYDSASDSESNRYSYIDPVAEADTMRRGVTVSRLPDIEEYIDQQLMTPDSQPSSGGGGDYEDTPTLSEEAYDDASSDLSEFFIATPTRDGLEIDSAPHSPYFNRSRNSRASKTLDSTDIQQFSTGKEQYLLKSISSPREGWSDCADSDDDFLSGGRPYESTTSVLDLDQCDSSVRSTSSDFQDDAITPSAPRTLDQPTNLFQSDFNNIFFSSNPLSANTALYNARKSLYTSEKSYDNMVNTTASIIGAKRNRESKGTVSLRPPEILDSDFNFRDTRSKLLESSSGSSLIRVPAAATRAITLSKDMLTDLKTIGQVDAKYLLVLSGKLILIVDQHAADERVKLEEMLGSMKTKGTEGGMGITDTLPVSETLELTPGDLFTLSSRAEIFRDWRFLFEIIESAEPIVEGAECVGAVRLTQVPVIYGEALNAQDFVEFVHSVSEYSRWMAPRSMLRPPAVQRIAASKACRSAVRFGDVLDYAASADIMTKLSTTDLPFQCAHGRPSVVPLLHLGQTHDSLHSSALPLSASKRSKYPKTANYSSLLL